MTTMKDTRRFVVRHHYYVYSYTKHRIVGRWHNPRKMFRFTVGYNNIPVHGTYHSITFTAWARKEGDLPNEDVAQEVIENEMRATFGRYWRDWIPSYWDRTGVSVQKIPHERGKPGTQNVEITEMGKSKK